MIVGQSKGMDSTVTIRESVVADWPNNKNLLIFETDQSLHSQSERAWNVIKAIANYAQPLGYIRYSEDKNSQTWIYDVNAHSRVTEYQIRQEIENSIKYQETLAECHQKRDEINNKYGQAIDQLKNLVSHLEDTRENKLKELRQELIKTQLKLVANIELPEHLQERERKVLTNPRYPFPNHLIERSTRKDINSLPNSDISDILDMI